MAIYGNRALNTVELVIIPFEFSVVSFFADGNIFSAYNIV